ncbi:YceI family protein [Mesonia maritima]|uniref:Polyisoprenoid-binding protein YceI n=1 Tax=Mesonia maritima TaxID=1793873 RepID=A0ABU1K4I1_9FLAO|nr:YceI family protein [Mesonia maritima]MDR6300524.1 polyisoprenoid-binding protein YceI [Mesonia maritima]
MKKGILNLFLLATIGIMAISCKEEAKNKTEAKEAEEVAEASAEASEYKLDSNESIVYWRGAKLTGGGHEGTIQFESGEFLMNNEMLEGGTLVIDMSSINVRDLEGEKKENLEAHLKGTVEGKEGDFFNVEKYNTAKFEITGVSEKEGKMMMSGNLTLKEKTNNIDVPVTITKGDDNEMVKIKSEPFTIDRTKWDVNYGSKSVFDNLVGDNVINDDIELEVNILAKKA